MPKKPPQQTPVAFKSGPVSVTPRPNGTWLFYWLDGGIRKRIAGPACSLNQAQALAAKVAQAVLNHRMGLGGADPSQLIHDAAGREFVDPHAPAVLSVRDALVEAIRLGSQGSQKHKAQLAGYANRFMAWIGKNHPSVKAWKQVSRSMVLAYLSTVPTDAKSKTVVAWLEPIRLAARFWAMESPEEYRDFTHCLPLPKRLEKSDPAPLTALQAVAFLARVEAVQPALAPVYALALTAGLRILEAASIRFRDLDLNAGTVVVADVPWHSVKTPASKRTVPVPAHGLEYVRRHLARLDAHPVPDGPLFTNQAGRPWNLDSLSCAWKRLTGRESDRRRNARNHLSGLDLPADFTPSECRATFATLARRSGCDSWLVECVMGHSAKSVLARHYEGVGLGDLRQVADAVQRVLNEACFSHACPTETPLEVSSL